jgi:hypothetical protein
MQEANNSQDNVQSPVSVDGANMQPARHTLQVGMQSPVDEDSFKDMSEVESDGVDISFDKSDPNAKLNEFGDYYYFGCVVPKGYIIRMSGVYKQYVTRQGRLEYHKISSIRVMAIGRFKGPRTDIVKLKYIDGLQMGEIYANMHDVVGNKEFKENLRPTLRLDDEEVKQMTKFLNKCITENQDLGQGCTAFEHGVAHTENGWTDSIYTQFVAGNRLFKKVGEKLVEEPCHFADPAGQDTFKPIGDINKFVQIIKPVLDTPEAGDRLRYAIYVTASAFLHGPLGIDPFLFDIYGGIPGAKNDKSGSGKSTMTSVALAMFGRIIETETAYSLAMPASSTEAFIRNKAAKLRDCPMGLGESTARKSNSKAANIELEKRIKIVYTLTEPNESGKAKDGKGNNQVSRRFCNTTLIDGEDQYIPTDGEIGARIRTPGIRGGLNVSGIGKIVSPIKIVARNNAGWFIKPFFELYYKYENNTKLWFDSAKQYYDEVAGDDDMAQRQASFAALIETAGWLVEEIFSMVGITKKNAREVSHAIWDEHLASNTVEPQWKLALEDIWDWVGVNYDHHFAMSDNARIDKRWGWFIKNNGNIYLNLHIDPVESMLKSKSRSPDSVFESFQARSILSQSNLKPKIKKDGTIGKLPIKTNATFKGDTKQVYQMNIMKLYEELELGNVPQGLDAINIIFKNNQITP